LQSAPNTNFFLRINDKDYNNASIMAINGFIISGFKSWSVGDVERFVKQYSPRAEIDVRFFSSFFS